MAALAVLLGTLYPLLLDALGLGKISVGPPYFDSVFMPLMAPTVFLMGVGPLARWKETDLPSLALRLRWAAVISVVASLATGAMAAGSVQTTAPASVTILSPTTITKTQNLVFGSVIRPSNANTNTVTLDANDTVTVTGTGNGSVVSSTTSSAKFDVSAPAATTYTTTQSLTFVQTGLTNINASAPATTNGSPGVIPVGGIQEIRYGGSFDMNAATPAQAYTGTLTVTVNYN